MPRGSRAGFRPAYALGYAEPPRVSISKQSLTVKQRLSGLCEIARHSLDPLPRLKSAQRVNIVLPGLILCLREVPGEGQRQENQD